MPDKSRAYRNTPVNSTALIRTARSMRVRVKILRRSRRFLNCRLNWFRIIQKVRSMPFQSNSLRSLVAESHRQQTPRITGRTITAAIKNRVTAISRAAGIPMPAQRRAVNSRRLNRDQDGSS